MGFTSQVSLHGSKPCGGRVGRGNGEGAPADSDCEGDGLLRGPFLFVAYRKALTDKGMIQAYQIVADISVGAIFTELVKY
jgi:hypothetical protein